MAVRTDTYSNGGARGSYKQTDLDFDPQLSRDHTTCAPGKENQNIFAHHDYQSGGSSSYVCPSQCHWLSSSGTDHSCSSEWCGHLSDLMLTSVGPDNMGKFKPSHIRPSSNTPGTPLTPVPTWDKPSTNGSMDFSMIQTETTSQYPDGDDDAKSDCMSCAESCSSHCGETGHGSICCDAEECVDQEECTDACEAHDPCADNCPGSEPCIDEECEAARTPCMDETCIAQTPPAQPARHEEAAAAQALTSFQGQADEGFGAETNFFDGLNFGGDHGFMDCNSGMDFVTGNFSGFGNHMEALSQANSFIIGQEATQPQGLHFTAEALRHILQYHDPCHTGHAHQCHVRPCIADHPRFKDLLCPLPALQPHHSHYGLANPASDCNFMITDAPQFAHHLRSHHGPLVSQLNSWSNSMAGTSFQTFQPGLQDCSYMPYADFQCNPDMMTQCFFANTDPGIPQAFQHHTPGSSATVPSLMNTPHAAQHSSAATSPCTDFFTGDYGLSESKPKSLNVPQAKPQAKPKGQGRSLGPDDAFRCYWEDHKTGLPCMQNFEDSDALDAHCKAAHVKDLPKQGPGFSCLWQGCKRTHDSFSTRAKLNRHLQTHTGYKPMKCPYCGLRLSAKQALDQHVRTHTGEHPYECKFGCGQKFKQHSALTMHHRVHTKEKPLSCDICGAKFTESSNLSKHMRTHSVKGHFDCDLCDKNFHRLDQLRRHLASNHKDQPEAAQGNIERAKNWKKKILREKRANMGAATGSSLEPLAETLTESSDTALGELDMDDGL